METLATIDPLANDSDFRVRLEAARALQRHPPV
jgi:hypothetical protein